MRAATSNPLSFHQCFHHHTTRSPHRSTRCGGGGSLQPHLPDFRVMSLTSPRPPEPPFPGGIEPSAVMEEFLLCRSCCHTKEYFHLGDQLRGFQPGCWERLDLRCDLRRLYLRSRERLDLSDRLVDLRLIRHRLRSRLDADFDSIDLGLGPNCCCVRVLRP